MAPAVSLTPLQRIETAFAVIHRSATDVYKRRKPVRLRLGREELALEAPEARRAACREEDALNRQLSADVARGVVPIARDASGDLVVGGDGPVVDWAVRMRRLPDGHRAQTRLEQGSLDDIALRAIAERLAIFHERTRGAAAPASDRVLEALRERIGLEVSLEGGSPPAPLPEIARQAEAWQRDFVAKQSTRLQARARTASIRRGHGELALDHVFVDDAGGVRILAGLEIAPRFRDADVTADVALLAADLAARHRVDLAERFVAEYARIANDFELYPLLDFYTSLRATLRAKLDWAAAAAFPPQAGRYRTRARRFLELAVAAPRRPLLPPMVVAMGGQVASGKSTIALEIARRIGAPVVGADATRDFLLGARLNQELHEVRWEASYAPEFPQRVYGEVLRRASEVLVSGRPVVIDGCFRSNDQRLRARALAERFDLPFLFVEARVSREVQRSRLVERAARDGVDIAEWQAIADQLRAQWQPVSELAPEEQLALDTSLPLEKSLERIEARIPGWPEGLTG